MARVARKATMEGKKTLVPIENKKDAELKRLKSKTLVPIENKKDAELKRLKSKTLVPIKNVTKKTAAKKTSRAKINERKYTY